MDLSARGVVLDYFSFVKVLAVFTNARLLFEPMQETFLRFFWHKGVIEMKVNNFLVGDFSL